jgi:hypothetical protein
VFEEITKDKDEYMFAKDVDEDIIQMLLQFMYKGEIDLTKKDKVVQFLLLATKVMF